MLKQFGVLLGFVVMFSACKFGKNELPPEEVIKPVYKYGYNINDFNVIEDTIKDGDTFGTIMLEYGININQVYNINEAAQKDSINLTKLKKNNVYTILTAQDTAETIKAFIYQVDDAEYWKIDFGDSLAVASRVKKVIKTEKRFASGIIHSSLFQTLESQNIDPALAITLSDVYKYSIDFYKIQKEDKFKILFDQQYIDDTIPYKTGKIYAAYFEHKKKPHYAFGYAYDSLNGRWQYYDEMARELKRMFLKSPIAFGRISSKYNMKRYVSIYGRIKPHFGTDFAAPVGTPIKTTANGVVVESSYRGGNGNYVKVKHNNTYTTQYLHMSKRAVKVGDHVHQGQVIGYVGMTGSTTGPHVCYRFWKNGKQVDPFKQDISKSEPLPDKYKPSYLEYIKPIKIELDTLGFKNIEI